MNPKMTSFGTCLKVKIWSLLLSVSLTTFLLTIRITLLPRAYPKDTADDWTGGMEAAPVAAPLGDEEAAPVSVLPF